ncbi:DUF4245 family protein [Microbacterium sp. CFBP9034]|uniref:DUF4245 family protein n=1 Tax=Microbacterium sp. CFBP9034 TaxID=3096540 RepID=UPI002A6AF886|nr:DUF4245 family protein [Microbacterium sp. CFBP9034]MDY0911078.1 DUF4245 family protein [Microbacterium sp. CFBP9034]
MARSPRIVAELGRPETPGETASRKAESSRVHRESQNTRNLVAALIVTVLVVVVIIFAVPRGTPPERAPIDVAAVAESVSTAEGRTVIVPDAPADWRVNVASVEGDAPRAWTVVYAPESGFLRVAQGFDADPAWAARMLSGARVDGTVTIDGITWDRYDIADPARAGNVSVALATEAGPDTVLIYGKADTATLEQAASAVATEVAELREESE